MKSKKYGFFYTHGMEINQCQSKPRQIEVDIEI